MQQVFLLVWPDNRIKIEVKLALIKKWLKVIDQEYLGTFEHTISYSSISRQ